ncbi:unnamed protein product, partial [Prorocentrum cordatum]
GYHPGAAPRQGVSPARSGAAAGDALQEGQADDLGGLGFGDLGWSTIQGYVFGVDGNVAADEDEGSSEEYNVWGDEEDGEDLQRRISESKEDVSRCCWSICVPVQLSA